MKNKKHCRFLPTFLIAITLYLSNTVCATAAEPSIISENTLPVEPSIISENALPAEAITVSANALPTAPTAVSPSASNAEPDYVSSSKDLTSWLNSHMYSGGRARLTANITMDSSYLFVPYPNLPPLIVETDGYSIFVSADVELWSDGHLTFSGTGNAQGLFHVNQGGSLLLDGVAVETLAENQDSHYALWQEEGASLTVGNTFAPSQITGNIHYAETPFVTDTDPVCVVVEKGQLLDELLPAKITCRVNYQGSYLEHEQVAVSWDMTDTQKQQSERQRFQAPGVFSLAQSHENPVCTVVYHDYPLTFTRADAFIRTGAYTFRGEYIKQEEALSAVTSPEYSFDGTNWISEGDHNTLNADNGFYISFPCNQWDTAVHPYIHIRLRAQTGEQVYYSNVLRYAANHLDVEEDLGGSRGGGTNIVDPPAEPEEPKNPTESNQPTKPNKPAQPAKPDKPNQPTEPTAPDSSTKPTESNRPVSSQAQTTPAADTPTTASNQTATTSASPDAAAHQKAQESDKNTGGDAITMPSEAVIDTSNPAATEPPAENNRLLAEHTLPSAEFPQSSNDDVSASYNKVTAAAAPVSAADRQTETLLLAAGFVLLSAAVGAVCHFVHIGKGGVHKRKSSSSGGTKR